MSEIGPRGERGPLGDHGQNGAPGRTGPTGSPGNTGNPGNTGPRGPAGADGHIGRRGPSLTRWQTIAGFLLVVVAFGTLGIRIEHQQREISVNSQRIALAQWQGCVDGVEILRRFNHQQDALANIERTTTIKLRPELAKQRISVYEDARTLPLPTCGPHP